VRACFTLAQTQARNAKVAALARLVLENDVQGVDDAGDVTEDREEDVNAEVGAAALLEEYTEGREDHGEDDLADVAVKGARVSRRPAVRRGMSEGGSYLAVKAIVIVVMSRLYDESIEAVWNVCFDVSDKDDVCEWFVE
jgi:hypothetical protein